MATKEKFEEAKRLYETANADQRYVLESLFPELRESEDERIRKSLILLVKSVQMQTGYDGVLSIKYNDMITWLEKQGKNKFIDDLTAQEAMDIAVAKCFEQGK